MLSGLVKTRQWNKPSFKSGFGDELAANIYREMVCNEAHSASSDEQLAALADVSVRAANAFVNRLLQEKEQVS